MKKEKEKASTSSVKWHNGNDGNRNPHKAAKAISEMHASDY